MDELKENFKKALKNKTPGIYEKIPKAIRGGTVTLTELLEDDVFPDNSINKLSLDFLAERIVHEAINIKKIIDKKIISDTQEVSLKEKVHELEERKRKKEISKHKEAIRKGDYTDNRIGILIKTKVLSEKELIEENILSKERIDEILIRPIPGGFEFDIFKLKEELKEIPSLALNRLDVFILGIPGSGKSCFMGGLLYHVFKEAKIETYELHEVANNYFTNLTQAIDNNTLPPRTPQEYINHLACSFKSSTGKAGEYNVHPFTFIEMSGEIFNQTYTTNKKKLPSKLSEYLFSENKKIFFFVINYESHINGKDKKAEKNQHNRFRTILNFLMNNKILDNAEGICVLVNKWDKCEDDREGAATEFLKDNYKNLIESCRDIAKKKGIFFKPFVYSLGKFNDREQYDFNPEYSREIYEWLSKIASAKKKVKISWWKKLFGLNG